MTFGPSRFPEYAREIKHALTDAHAVCERLGLVGGPRSFLRQAAGVIVRCPFHEERTPSCSIRRAGDGTLAVKCHGCDAGGDVLTLIARVHGLSARSDFKLVLLAGAEMAGLWQIVHELESGAAPAERPAPVATPLPPVQVDERTYPPAADVDAVWSAATAPSCDPEASAWLTGRGIDPERVDGDVARVVSTDARLPRWASYQGASWTKTGHRLLVPMRDPSGTIRSVRGVRIVDGNTPKRLPPGGHKAAGLVMACALGAAMLAGTFAPRQVLVLEGEPDFLVGVAAWRQPVSTARIGIVSGGWTTGFAQRVPVGTPVYVATDPDAAGNRYANEMFAALKRGRGCPVFRVSLSEVA